MAAWPVASGEGAQGATLSVADGARGDGSRSGVLKLYRLLTTLARPAAGVLLRHRAGKGKELPERLAERLGISGLARPKGPLLWFHAASVGETNAVLPLMHALKARHPALNILLTTVTVTSAKIAAARLPEGAVHQFAPLDSPVFVRRFLTHWRPEAGLFVESEIWPNLILEAKARGMPLVLLNARMSARSYARWAHFLGASKALFSKFDIVLAQDEGAAERFARLGARASMAVGNLKYDAPPPPVDEGALRALKEVVGGRPVFLAVSTHPGEDELVLEAHRRLRQARPDALAIIAPRHPERGEEICALARAMRFNVARRSQGEPISAATDVYVADTIGELGLFYRLSPLAFIGKTLKAQGGQNPIEAIKLGCAVIAGPNTQNFAEVFATLDGAKGCVRAGDADSLSQALVRLFAHPEEAAVLRSAAEAAISAHMGAKERTLKALAALVSAPLAAGALAGGGGPMTLRPPAWWYAGRLPKLAWALWPLAKAYGGAVRLRFAHTDPFVSALPVVCIGNLTVGGAGKTPVALTLAQLLKEQGIRPGFLTRGYGGVERGPRLVDLNRDGADLVGDEPLLLGREAPTVVARARPDGARLLETLGVDVILMDDGFQNPSLAKDVSFVVVDAGAGVGCGQVFPLGPLRAPLSFQLEMADAVIVVSSGPRLSRFEGRFGRLPVFHAEIVIDPALDLGGVPVVAYCGIGRPEKFFETLEGAGAHLLERVSFPDHHPYTEAEASALLALASARKARLVTTQKDGARLKNAVGAQKELKDLSLEVGISLKFADEGEQNLLQMILTAIDEKKDRFDIKN